MGDPIAKRDMVLALLAEAVAVQVFFDPRRAGVVLPEGVTDPRSPWRLRLDYGLNLPRAIDDLRVDEQGIRATLSFGGVPSETFVPWSAVYVACADHVGGCAWTDDFPPEEHFTVQRADAGPRPVPEDLQPPGVVAAAAQDQPAETAHSTSQDEAQRRRALFKVV